MAQTITLWEAVDVFVDGFALLQGIVGPVTYGRHPRMRYLTFAAGRRRTRFVHEFFLVGMDPSVAIAATREIASGAPFLVNLLGQGDGLHRPAYEAAGFRYWGEETVMAMHLAGLAPVSGAFDIRPVGSRAEAEAIERAQAAAGGRVHPVTQAHIDAPNVIDRWVAAGNEVAAFGRVALLGRAAYLSDVVTLPAHRRRGYAGAVVRRLLADARAAGAERCVLASSEMGYPLYRAIGFADVTTLFGFEVD